MPRPATYRRVK